MLGFQVSQRKNLLFLIVLWNKYHELPSIKLDKTHFCHRRLLADWIELETGIVIPEISIDKTEIVKYQKVYDLKPKIKTLIK